MNAKFWDLREELYTLMSMDVTLQAAAEQMTRHITDPKARKRKISSIRRYWGNNKSWIGDLTRIRNPTIFDEIVGSVNLAVSKAWLEYATGDNTSARVAALRTIISAKMNLAEMLMKAGYIPMAPQHFESTLTFPGTPFDCDPELKRALLEEAERQRQEKEKQNAQPT